MPFSAATCLTFNPTLQSAVGPFEIYLNSDYSSTPFVSNIDLSELTPPNCPFIIQNIPTGTSNLGFKDITKEYCITIPIQNNDICVNCNLGFSNYSSSTISRIYCGELTGSCEFDDYKINWYGPDDTTTLQFTSGKGIFASESDYQHPFSTNLTSIPVNSGVYTPVIDKIIINGVTFSNTGGTNNILFSGNCLPTTTILPLTCSNKTNSDTSWPSSAYSHTIKFDNTTGVNPQPVKTTYELSASTKFLAIAFKGYSFLDRLEIQFSGSNYTDSIGLEDVLVGTKFNDTTLLTTSNFNLNSFPKTALTSNFFTKIICLTGLTVNSGDKILTTVTPYNNVTSWDFYITCLDDYDCSECLLTQPYKIIGSSISGVTATCNTIKVNYKISGCTSLFSDISDYFTYYIFSQGTMYNITAHRSIGTTPQYNNGVIDLFFQSVRCTNTQRIISSPTCSSSSEETIYRKTFVNGFGVFSITGSSEVISEYYNSWFSAINNPLYSGSTDSTTLSYYRYFTIVFPNPNSTVDCDDGEQGKSILVHHTSNVISGITSGSKYFFSLTANTIQNNTSFASCDLFCSSSVFNNIGNVNIYSTGTTSFYGINSNFIIGKYFKNPISRVDFITSGSTTQTADTNINISYFTTFEWSTNTYPFSGLTPTLIPSLSGSICNYNNIGVYRPLYNSSYRNNYKYHFETRLTNPSNINDFDIWASPINNLSYSGAPSPTPFFELAYRYSGGNVTYSSSTYIIG